MPITVEGGGYDLRRMSPALLSLMERGVMEPERLITHRASLRSDGRGLRDGLPAREIDVGCDLRVVVGVLSSAVYQVKTPS